MAGLLEQQEGAAGMRQGAEEDAELPVRQGAEGAHVAQDGEGQRRRSHTGRADAGEPHRRADVAGDDFVLSRDGEA